MGGRGGRGFGEASQTGAGGGACDGAPLVKVKVHGGDVTVASR